MMGGQKQDVGDNSTAVQSTGPVTINQGISPKQMIEIMELLREFDKNTAEAYVKTNERIDIFQREMLEKFADSKNANPEAFKDPDFLFVLKNAQINCARDDGETTSKLLVELLAERSKRPSRDRTALILNEASEKVSKVTDEDLVVLGVCFLIFHSVTISPNSNDLLKSLNKNLKPFLSHLKTETSAYAYLESIGCLTKNNLIERDILSLFKEQYSEMFTDGFSTLEINNIIDDVDKRKIIINLTQPINTTSKVNHYFNFKNYSEMNSSPTLYRFVEQTRSKLILELNELDFTETEIANIVALLEEKSWSIDKITELLINNIEGFDRLLKIWKKSEMQQISLTSVGIAIAHAHLSNTINDFNAPLSIWIK